MEVSATLLAENVNRDSILAPVVLLESNCYVMNSQKVLTEDWHKLFYNLCQTNLSQMCMIHLKLEKIFYWLYLIAACVQVSVSLM